MVQKGDRTGVRVEVMPDKFRSFAHDCLRMAPHCRPSAKGAFEYFKVLAIEPVCVTKRQLSEVILPTASSSAESVPPLDEAEFTKRVVTTVMRGSEVDATEFERTTRSL